MGCKTKALRRPMRRMATGGSSTSVSSVTSAVGGIYGAAHAIGDPAIQAEEDRYNPNTGQFDNIGRVETAGYAEAVIDPLTTLSTKGTLNMDKYYRNMEKDRMAAAYSKNIAGTSGYSGNPYTELMCHGGYVKYAEGGNVAPQGSTIVELEKGEPYRLPSGEIKQIPVDAPSHAQGGVTMNLPVGTQVLGKKPSKQDHKQFKELGRKLKTAQDKYEKALKENPTSVAANTAKRMLDNINTEYSKLFEEQGVDTGHIPGDSENQTIMSQGQEQGEYGKGGSIHINPKNKGKFNALKKRTGKTTEELKHSSNPLTRKRATFAANAKKWHHADGGYVYADGGVVDPNDYTTSNVYTPFTHPTTGKQFYAVKYNDAMKARRDVFPLDSTKQIYGTYVPPNKHNGINYAPSMETKFRNGQVQYALPNGYEQYNKQATPPEQLNKKFWQGGIVPKFGDGNNWYDPAWEGNDISIPYRSDYVTLDKTQIPTPVTSNPSPAVKYTPSMSKYDASYNPQTYANKGNLPDSAMGSTPTTGLSVQPTTSPSSSGFSWGDTANAIGALAPVAYNIGQGMLKSEKLNAKDYQNPYNQYVRSLMSKRSYDSKPELDETNIGQATYNRQLRESGAGPSSYYGGLQAGSIIKNRAAGEVLSRAGNMNNEYRAQEAQMNVGLGKDIAATNMGIKQVNDQNAAARRNFMSTGLSQLSQYSQNNQLMNNQMVRDIQRMNLLPALVQNFTLTPDGKWIFKGDNTEWTQDQVSKYVKGGK